MPMAPRSRSPSWPTPARTWFGSRSIPRRPPPPCRRSSARSATLARPSRSWATSTTTATICSPSSPRRRGRSPSTASIPAMWAPGVTTRLAEPREPNDVMIDAMVESAVRSAELAESTGLAHDRIILSAKVSGVRDLVAVYRKLAARGDYALHLGLTEAGMGMKGIVASTAGLSLLLAEGIGDTIRVSITPEPGGDRTEEVMVAQQVLQSLGIRPFLPQVTSCPGCGRTTSTYFQELARDVQIYLRDQMPV